MSLAIWYTVHTGQCDMINSGVVAPGRLVCKTEINTAAVPLAHGIWPQQSYRCLLQKQCKTELTSMCRSITTVEVVLRVSYRFFRPVALLPRRSVAAKPRELYPERDVQATWALYCTQRPPTEAERAQLTACSALLAKTAQAVCSVETK
jgi:hypothetical protein